MLARVTEAGGKVLQGKQLMGETIGWLAYVEDTEGNHIGIQQQA
jgi:predicted enzyme related to lactoylglutathione lyase